MVSTTDNTQHQRKRGWRSRSRDQRRLPRRPNGGPDRQQMDPVDRARSRRGPPPVQRTRTVVLISGISPKTLSERLKRLEEAHVVDRECFAEVPPRVEYSLTEKGFALLPVIDQMREFGTRWLPSNDCPPDGDD